MILQVSMLEMYHCVIQDSFDLPQFPNNACHLLKLDCFIQVGILFDALV